MSLIVGVDVGQAIDPTVITVADAYVPEPADVDDHPEYELMIRWLEKVPLGTSYVAVVERIATVAEQAAMFGPTMIVLDATGVGRPLVDMLRRRTSVSMRAVTFTAGRFADEAHHDPYNYRVPKRDLVTALEVLLQGRRIHAVPGLPLAEDMRAELGAFEVGISTGGRDSYEAASGSHDDIVMALALAAWCAGRPGGAGWIQHYQNRAARNSSSPVMTTN
jgi:hypothetical protein